MTQVAAKPSLPEEPNITVDAASRRMIIRFVTMSPSEPTLSWTFAGKPISLTGGQYSMNKVAKDGQFIYTFEINEVSYCCCILLKLAADC